MNQITQYHLFIAAEVNRMLLEREMTVRYCSDEFNIKYKHQISTGECHPMTKDFVQRVRTGRFKVFTPRVAKLCDFLAIDQTLYAKQNIISDELGRKMQVIDCLIRDDLMLQKKVSRLLDDITELLRA